LFLGQMEQDVVAFFQAFLQPGNVVLDLGANVGVFTLLGAKYVGRSGQVHAFEPTPGTFAQLRANVELNNCACVRLNQLAVADKPAKSTFFVYAQCGMNSMRRQEWVGAPIEEITVDAVSVDDYVDVHGLNRVDLIKIDVEGAELMVLDGASRVLTGPNAPVLICEFTNKTTSGFGYRAAAIRERLESLGYRLYRWNCKERRLVSEPVARNYEIYANLVCMKPTHPQHALAANIHQ
jgi:FkbM family methyltransferase